MKNENIMGTSTAVAKQALHQVCQILSINRVKYIE